MLFFGNFGFGGPRTSSKFIARWLNSGGMHLGKEIRNIKQKDRRQRSPEPSRDHVGVLSKETCCSFLFVDVLASRGLARQLRSMGILWFGEDTPFWVEQARALLNHLSPTPTQRLLPASCPPFSAV